MKNKSSKHLSVIKMIFFITINSFLLNAQQTYTFTNASATGATCPTQAQVNSAYATNNLNGLVPPPPPTPPIPPFAYGKAPTLPPKAPLVKDNAGPVVPPPSP